MTTTGHVGNHVAGFLNPTQPNRKDDPMKPERAFLSGGFPCNPRPFALRINELCEENGSDAIQSDDAKACLWVLMAQAYGQMASIDLVDEWDRLRKACERGTVDLCTVVDTPEPVGWSDINADKVVHWAP